MQGKESDQMDTIMKLQLSLKTDKIKQLEQKLSDLYSKLHRDTEEQEEFRQIASDAEAFLKKKITDLQDKLERQEFSFQQREYRYVGLEKLVREMMAQDDLQSGQ